MQRRYACAPPQAPPGPHEGVPAWQAAVELAVECYLRTAAFPWTERSGLAARMRRAAVALVSSIADGHARANRVGSAAHLRVAREALEELEVYIEAAARLGCMDDEARSRALELCGDVARHLTESSSDIASGSAVADRDPSPALTGGAAARASALIQ